MRISPQILVIASLHLNATAFMLAALLKVSHSRGASIPNRRFVQTFGSRSWLTFLGQTEYPIRIFADSLTSSGVLFSRIVHA